MAVFKCKMCGGALNIENGASVIECDFCGTTQTLPKLDDERRANLYDRANHFRRNNDYDKATAIYEQILNEDNTDAEAYWSILLCKYGVEYVEDPASKKRVPTINRTQFISILADEDYKSALEYADGYQKDVYIEQAKEIDKIQKGILAISQKEEPFDVFICYKETDDTGRRTIDSVLAQELYFGLKKEGFKVFFSRITLEDKLGVAYEPYIFAALNSAKAMVVLGTKSEYFQAVWVKNEWKRYLSLIKQGKNKTLIPAYKDMDPYDLPEEFSHLQAQDMSKLGFMQDLIRGIKKIVGSATPKQPVVKETVVVDTVKDVAPLIRRANLFLESHDFESADKYAEKVLDINPEFAEAYLIKLMVDLEVCSTSEMIEHAEYELSENANYQMAVRFADDKFKAKLIEYNKQIIINIEQARIEGIYNEACELYEQGKYKKAIEVFSTLGNYKDCNKKISDCQNAIKEIIYQRALKGVRPDEFQCSAISKSIADLKSISGYRDADQRCVQLEALKANYWANQEKQQQDKINKKSTAKKVCLIMMAVLLALTVTFIIVGATADNGVAGWIFLAINLFVGAMITMGQGIKCHNYVKYINNGEYASLIGDENLIDFKVPDGVKAIKPNAFMNCANLQNVYIPEGVEIIGGGAFIGCTSLRCVEIPSTVTEIYSRAFDECPSIVNIIVNSNNRTYKDCDGALYTKNLTKLIKYPSGKVNKTVEIPEGVLEICDGAFYGASTITSVSIPNSIQVIGNGAFYGCSALMCKIKDGLKYLGNETNEYLYMIGAKNTSIKKAIIDDDCRFVESGAFRNCKDLSYVVLPQKLKEIKHATFLYCISLRTVVIPPEVESIECGAFAFCLSLEKIIFTDQLNWYRAENYADWKNKVNGVPTPMHDIANNVKYFTDWYSNSFWYKLK